jgi:isopenicillin N synthase-like dioxygenase
MPGIKRTVPVIDVSNFDSRKEEIKQSMLEAAEQVGFFQVVGHGIPKSMIDGMFALSKAFFNLDDEVKAKYPFAGWNAGWEKMKQIRFARVWSWFHAVQHSPH